MSGRRLEMPYVPELGTSTTKRPGRLTSWVSRAPLTPMGFFVTWQMIVCLALRTSSMRGLPPLPSTSSGSKVMSLRYSTAFFGVPMSTKAASMPGSTLATRAR